MLYFEACKFEIMNVKLTLELNPDVIHRAKLYAKKQDISLSKLIENYLSALTAPTEKRTEITPLVESLFGVIDVEHTPERKNYLDYLSEKYS